MFFISVEEMISGETAIEEAGTSSSVMSNLTNDKLLVFQFLDIFVSSSQFKSTVRNWDNLSATLLNEASFQLVLIDHAMCQVKYCRVWTGLDVPNIVEHLGVRFFSRSLSCVFRWTFSVSKCGWHYVMQESNVFACFCSEN